MSTTAARARTESTRTARWSLPAVSLAALDEAQARALGEEAIDLHALRSAGLPVVEGIVVAIDADGRAALQAELQRVPFARFSLRPLFPTRAAALRFERRLLGPREADGAEAVLAAFDRVLAAAEQPDVKAVFGGSAGTFCARVHVIDRDAPEGRAASADPVSGDPDLLRVWATHESPWIVDRRTARVVESGGGIEAPLASAVADLADRAQLCLGRPVEIEWTTQGGQPRLLAVHPLLLEPRFTSSPHRIVTLVAQDEGTVAPLAVDVLDRALRRDDPSDEPRVRRIYARPYRRLDERTPLSLPSDPVSIVRATVQAARVAADVVSPLRAVQHFEDALPARLRALDAIDPASLGDAALLDCLRERARLVIEAFELLERGKNATLAALVALEAVVGPLPQEAVPALAHPRPTRERRRLEERLARLASRIERDAADGLGGSALPPALRRRLDELAADLAEVRSIGIDIRPVPWGSSPEALREALQAARLEPSEARERARRDAGRRLLATARGQPLGRARELLCASLLVLLDRVARAKGSAADALARSMLRLRAAACEVGRRLAERGTLETAEDALYLDLTELEQALVGEPGAYAARVRLRREDDARWARYDAPRRIAGRGS
ncbi:MAG: hypothetical protein NZ898_12380 [Myxococcota bacterium]|nr:hypothetical protein [Myxococcota bacterium]MDW8361051.1 hypothetical protein [Myxococcales bacterium]